VLAVPENCEVAAVEEAKVPPVPETTDQAPVPLTAVLAARITEEAQLFNWSDPALAVVMVGTKLMSTSSVLVPQLVVVVQRKVEVDPAVPVKVLVALEAVVTEPPDPLIIVQAPVPELGVLAAKVSEVPHFCS
jgi:hypothetical protein